LRITLLFTSTLLILSYLSLDAAESNKILQEVNYNSTNANLVIEKNTNTESWVELKKPTTNKAFRAFGKPISVSNYSQVNEANVKEIALKFIDDNQKLLGVDKNQIVYNNAHFVNGKWYVHLKQVINGMTVAFSSIDLRINDRAQVFSYGVEYFETDDVSLEPKINFNEAYANESITHPDSKSYITDNNKPELFAFPIYKNGKYTIEAAYRTEYNYENNDYSVYISSIDGETLFRKKLTHDLKTTVEVFTNIKQENQFGPVLKVPAPHQTISIQGKNYITDSNGLIELDLETTLQVPINFEGPWVRFQNNVFTQGKINTVIEPGENNLVEWDDTNSDIRERMVVYHLNKIRDYYKAFDSTKTAMDFQIQLRFDTFGGSQPNAYSSGRVIGYIGMNNPSANFAETPTVLYHEYGHSINRLLYIELGQREGMINGAANEGIADITASFMVDDSRVGYGAFSDPNRIIRNCKNNFKYPDDLIGEVHHDGQIIAGAMWDIRDLTDLETARNLAHFTRYGLPDDADNGICFSEWLIETLIADDDDGDLTNGTPHSDAIIEAYDNHNINLDFQLENSLIHNQDSQLLDSESSVSIDCRLDVVTNFFNDSLELSLVYSYDNFETRNEIEFNEFDESSGDYNFQINKEQAYGVLSYYFNLRNISTGELRTEIKNESGLQTFLHVFGLREWYREDMTSNEWTFNREVELGAQFEIAVPEITYVTGKSALLLQTTDSDDIDDICLVTGAKFITGSYWTNMPYGYMEAFSPKINIDKFIYPVFKFSLWYSKNVIIEGSDLDFYLDISSDGGANWVEAYKLDDELSPTGAWNENAVFLKDYIDFTNEFRFRVRVVPNSLFNISAGYPNCFSEFQVDDISILDLATISSVEDEQYDSYKIFVEKDFINIYSLDRSFDNVDVSIFDINGKSVESTLTNNSNSNIRISRNNMAKGVYFLEINNGTTSITKKVLLHE